MKTITIDFELYQEELRKAEYKGFSDGLDQALNIFKKVMTDKPEAAVMVIETFEEKNKIDLAVNALGLKEYL